MKNIFFLAILLMTFSLSFSFLNAQFVSATYTAGDIEATYSSNPTINTLADNPGILNVVIPGGVIITSVDVTYDFTSVNGPWLSEQASYIKCVSPGGTSETELSWGPSHNMGGTYTYIREGLNIANNIVDGGQITFELHPFIIYNWGDAFVENNSWTITVHYETVEAGTLEGNVFDSFTNQPLSDVLVEILGTFFVTTTDSYGYFEFPFIVEGFYDIQASLFGYHSQVIADVEINEDQTTNISINLIQLDNVSVSGQITGSDYPDIGLAGAEVQLWGFDNYENTTDTNGFFSISGVYSNNTYELFANANGYSPILIEVFVGDSDLDLGPIILDEVAYSPYNLVATQNPEGTEVDLYWNVPLPVDFYFNDFENDDGGWISGSIQGTDNWEWGQPNQTHINSAYSGNNVWMTGLTDNYSNDVNIWLRSPEFNFLGLDEPFFSVWLNIHTENGFDGMILESSVDGGSSWQRVDGDDGFYNNYSSWGQIPPPRWSGTIGQWEHFSTFIPELANESSVYLRFRFQSDASGVYNGIAIDDIYIGPAPEFLVTSINLGNGEMSRYLNNSFRDNRILEGYRLFRFLDEDTSDESSWLELTTVTDTAYTDLAWTDVSNDFYRYAVKAVYTGDLLSEPAISNWIRKNTEVSVNITSNTGDSTEGAVIYLTNTDNLPDGENPVYYEIAVGDNPSVAHFTNIMRGNYTLSVVLSGFYSYIETNITIEEPVIFNVELEEVPYPIHNLVATQNTESTEIELVWVTPLAIDYYFSDFENNNGGWIGVGTGTGGNHWEWGQPSQANINSAYSGNNVWMTRLTSNYENNANTWLQSPEFNFTGILDPYFSVWLNLYSEPGWDGMVLESSFDGGATWQRVGSDTPGFYNNTSTSGPLPPPKWSGRIGTWTEYSTPLNGLENQPSVYLRFLFMSDDMIVDEGMAIDHVYVGPEAIDFSVSDSFSNQESFTGQWINNLSNRALEEYRVYRLLAQHIDDMEEWVEIVITQDTTFVDTDWANTVDDFHRYAVKALYTGDVLSPPVFSNWVRKKTEVTVNITSNSNDNVDEAVVTLTYVDTVPDGVNPVYTETAYGNDISIANFVNVLRGHYDLQIDLPGFQTYTENNIPILESTVLDIELFQVPYPPLNLVASKNSEDTEVDLIWNVPLPIDYHFSDFEEDDGGWISGSIQGTNHWEWGEPGQVDINSAYSGSNVWMTGLNNNYTSNINIWLQSPELNFTEIAEPFFSVWLNIYSEEGHDGMILESSIDGGASWQRVDGDPGFYNDDVPWGEIPPPRWAGFIGQWQHFSTFIPELANEPSVFFRFRFQTDFIMNYEGIAIDDVYIGPEPCALIPLRSDSRFFLEEKNNKQLFRDNNHNRLPDNYIIYRFLHDDIGNEDNWLELAIVPDTTYTDLSWDYADSGFYRYAVKAVYTDEILSTPAFSNWVDKDMVTNVLFNITTNSGDSAEGAVVTLTYQDQDPDGQSPVYIEYASGSSPSEADFSEVLKGHYNIEVNLQGFTIHSQANVLIDGFMEFDIEIDEIPYPPINLNFTVGNNTVNLMWSPPAPDLRATSFKEKIQRMEEMVEQGHLTKEDSEIMLDDIKKSISAERSSTSLSNRALLGYNIYRDGVLINNEVVTDLFYTDTELDNYVPYIYFVTAQYTLEESAPSNSVTAIPSPQNLVFIGDENTLFTSHRVPFNFNYLNSLTQTLYMQSEIGTGGLITEIQYYTSWTTNLTDMPVRIWMAETDLIQIDNTSWTPASEMTLVFDGNVDFMTGEHTISLELDELFFYNGTNNLLVMAKRPMDTDWYSSQDRFYYTNTPEYPNRTVFAFSDTITFDPEVPPNSGGLVSYAPNAGLNIVSVAVGNLGGYVYDEDGTPIPGATVTLLETHLETQTDSEGYYFFSFVFEGEQEVRASSFGYYDNIQDIEIIENESLELNFTLQLLPNIEVTGNVVGSDFPDIGLEGAQVVLDGYSYYETLTGSNGDFLFSDVFADQNYELIVTYPGYDIYEEFINIGNIDEDLGTVILNEMAFPPTNVTAEILTDADVEIVWTSPGSAPYVEFRYDDGVPDGHLGFPSGTDESVLGSVYRRDAEIHEVSWYTTSEGGPHNTINLFIFGLNAQGDPNSNDILYQANNVPNQDYQWNVYELAEPLEAPNGFLVGLSYAGYLGIAVDDGVGAPWDFVPNTQYGIQNYTTGDWMPIEQWDSEVNYLIRAYGFDYGPAYREDLRLTGRRVPAVSSERDIKPSYISFDRKHQTPEETAYDPSLPNLKKSLQTSKTQEKSSRILEMYTIFRLEPGQEFHENLWSEIGTVMAPDTTFIDTGFAPLNPGFYRYAVKSVHTHNVISLPAFSNVIEHDMYAQVTTNVYTNSGDSPTGAVITLTNHNENPDHVYTLTSPPSGIVIFNQVWKGLYEVTVYKQGFEVYNAENVDFTSSASTYNLQLIEAIWPVVDLTYSVEQNNVMLQWLEPWAEGSGESVLQTGAVYAEKMLSCKIRNESGITISTEKTVSRSNRALLNYVVYRNDAIIADNVINLFYHDENLEDGVYTYGVKAVYTTGESEIIYTDEIEIDESDVAEDTIQVFRTELRGNYPNPFNPDTVISFSLKEISDVLIEIYNLRGQRIRVLAEGEFTAGVHHLTWDGKTDIDRDAGSGLFFYRMKTEKYNSTKKMILLK